MTSRQDELARKLTEGEVPEPPKDLLRRIKSDIPKEIRAIDLHSDLPPRKLWQSTWAVAASVLVLVAMSYVMLRVLSNSGFSREGLVEKTTIPEADSSSGVAAGDSSEPSGASIAPVEPSLQITSTRPENRSSARSSSSGSGSRVGTREQEAAKAESMLAEGRVSTSSTPPAGTAPFAKDAVSQLMVAAPPPKPGVTSGVIGGVSRGVPGGVSRNAIVESTTVSAAFPAPTPAEMPVSGKRGSTGGNAEPNDEPYDAVFFRNYGVNPFIDTDDDKLSTFGLDVDTGSYSVARRFLRDGHLPPAAAIRVEEFINYFRYGDRPPQRGDFAIYAEGAPSPYPIGERYQVLRIGIRAREVDSSRRKPATLTFVVDVSGSMSRENRLGLVRQALGMLLDRMRPSDEVGLVVYGSRGEVILEPTSDVQSIREAIDRLQPGGSTNAEEGLLLGYRVAHDHFRKGAINRIILCSDGVANVGRTGAGSILERVTKEARSGIELSTIGFGMGNYNDVLMEQLADRGDGSYAYVDDLNEARRVFVENLTGMLQTIAADAKVQVEFDPTTVSRYRLLGYENRDIADERFRDDSVDAGEIGAGHAVTALYELKLQPSVRSGRVATVHLRYADIDDGRKVKEIAKEISLRDFASDWASSSPSLRLATLVGKWAETLKGSYWARNVDPEDLFLKAQKLSPELLGDKDVADFVSLVGRSVGIAPPPKGTIEEEP